jgi:hypothetical protein
MAQFKSSLVKLVIIKVYLLHVCSFCVLYDDFKSDFFVYSPGTHLLVEGLKMYYPPAVRSF